MGRNNYPWVQFHYRDWTTDSALSRCSLASRGLWIELLSCFWADKVGRFEGTTEELSRLTRCTPEEAEMAARELIKCKVADGHVHSSSVECPADVLILSRRIESELNSMESDRERKRRERVRDLSEDCPPVCPEEIPLQRQRQRQSTKTDTKTDTKKKITSPAPSTDGFSEFYAAYPRKKARPKAEAAWKKIKPDSALRAKIMDHVRRSSVSHEWTKENGQFIPFPATYLNGARWEDDVDGALEPDDGMGGFAKYGAVDFSDEEAVKKLTERLDKRLGKPQAIAGAASGHENATSLNGTSFLGIPEPRVHADSGKDEEIAF